MTTYDGDRKNVPEPELQQDFSKSFTYIFSPLCSIHWQLLTAFLNKLKLTCFTAPPKLKLIDVMNGPINNGKPFHQDIERILVNDYINAYKKKSHYMKIIENIIKIAENISERMNPIPNRTNFC